MKKFARYRKKKKRLSGTQICHMQKNCSRDRETLKPELMKSGKKKKRRKNVNI